MISREAVHEYAAGALWVRPTAASIAALAAGSVLTNITISPDSWLAPLAFQGTADDARTLLIGITSTVVTVIALVLGLTVVALQLSSTQFSPRLLRNFLRDRPNQLVLSVFMATFAYSAAGLYTVGVAGGTRTEVFPRLAVNGAIVALFISLGTVVFFADHLAHSIQIDAITRQVERHTVTVVRHHRLTHPVDTTPDDVAAPSWAVAVPALASGYVQTAHPEALLPIAVEQQVSIRLRPRVGEHVVEGTTLAWIWRPAPTDPPPKLTVLVREVQAAVRIGFERTLEQDPGLGIRQLTDMACKALSPAVNDPYTAVQAVDRLAVVLAEVSRTPLGPTLVRDPGGSPSVVVLPNSSYSTYLRTPCGLIRRYGAGEPTVCLALLRMLAVCGAAAGDDPARWRVIDREAALILTDAEHLIAQPADLVIVRERAASLRSAAAALAPSS